MELFSREEIRDILNIFIEIYLKKIRIIKNKIHNIFLRKSKSIAPSARSTGFAIVNPKGSKHGRLRETYRVAPVTANGRV